ncbi:hypothetical protein Pan161_04640 [Gimesia algae]|uniref:Uncharacterized protein n=1 Tax=Gimesia algae TaxID=2527971 RepID=A0A517V769_9PLAN|nr:hypothetical protein Pan161_04640 [Gimesia algae]
MCISCLVWESIHVDSKAATGRARLKLKYPGAQHGISQKLTTMIRVPVSYHRLPENKNDFPYQ